jgi:hypothetical protein
MVKQPSWSFSLAKKEKKLVIADNRIEILMAQRENEGRNEQNISNEK